MINPRGLGLASVLVLSLLLVVAAAPATARDFTLKGRSDLTSDCNADARFRFTVSLAKGRFVQVKDFRTYGIKYPNTVLDGSAGFPIPTGQPSGKCLPGDDGWQTHEWQCPDGPERLCTEIPALGDFFVNNEFHGVFVHRTVVGVYNEPLTIESKAVTGKVYVKRRKKAHKFKIRAVGDFIDALGGESGLEFGGVSTAHVGWWAHN
jgi:hypothetical protein